MKDKKKPFSFLSKSSKREVTNPISPMPLSAISNPKDLVKKKGDFMLFTKTEKGDDVLKVYADGIKRTAVKYNSTGKIVETIVH